MSNETCNLCGEPKPSNIDHIWACCGDGPGYGDTIKPEKLACVERQLANYKAALESEKRATGHLSRQLTEALTRAEVTEAKVVELTDELEAEKRRTFAKLNDADARFARSEDGYEDKLTELTQECQRLRGQLEELAGDDCSPGFGVDPRDSSALLSLREAIDAVDIWPSDTAKEAGDYEAAVAHMATQLREREVEMQRWLSHLEHCSLDAQAFTKCERLTFGMAFARFRTLHELKFGSLATPPIQPPPVPQVARVVTSLSEVWVGEFDTLTGTAATLMTSRHQAEAYLRVTPIAGNPRIQRFVPESRPQSQGVPTVTREHREAAEAAWRESNDPASEGFGPERVAEAIAAAYQAGLADRDERCLQSDMQRIREKLAFERGRSQSAGDAVPPIALGAANLARVTKAAYERGRLDASQGAGDGWVDPAKTPPQVDTFAWVVWNGTVQRQPWEWVNTDEDEQLWHFDGHTLPADEVDAYLPLKLPVPPSDSGKVE